MGAAYLILPVAEQWGGGRGNASDGGAFAHPPLHQAPLGPPPHAYGTGRIS